MFPRSSLEVLGLSALVDRARAEGHVVGRGVGFVSREWRAGAGVGLAVHGDPTERELACVQPFVAGRPWDPWTLVSVHVGKPCGHCAPALLRDGAGVEVRGIVPDFAARRKMFPVGAEVQASVVLVAETWRMAERDEPLVRGLAEDDGAAAIVSGVVSQLESIRPEATGVPLVRLAIGAGVSRVFAVGRADPSVREGARVAATGRVIVRVGAPRHVRGAATSA